MRARELIVLVAAAVTLSMGLMQALPAYAAPAVPAAHQAGIDVPLAPNGVLRSRSVDTKASGNCAEFKGTLTYYAYPIARNYEFQFQVEGTLYARCGGTAHLRAYWECNNSPQSELIGDTRGTQKIDWSSPECSYGITNMYVEVCFFSSSRGGCANSAKL
jgi:hypothetical protein